jgi:hypothetical protein
VQSEMAKNYATAFSSLQHAWLRSAVETISHRLPPVLWDGIGGMCFPLASL